MMHDINLFWFSISCADDLLCGVVCARCLVAIFFAAKISLSGNIFIPKTGATAVFL